MDSEPITVSTSDREYKKKRVEELGSTLAKIRARVKANRGSSAKNEDEVQQSGGSKAPEESERTALTTKLEEDRVRFSKHQSEKAKIKEAMDQMMIEREEQKKVEKQLQEVIAKVKAPTPELPPLIKQRIIDLETTVENLKERLNEKDKVLSSKSQALTVLHNQLMQRSQEHAERAMAITQEISTLKEDFGKREENWKKEMLRLKGREEELEQKLNEKEIHTADIESLQKELNEALQALNDVSNRNEDISTKLENMNKINLKLKAQLKVVKQERDKFKESIGSQEDLESLKNRIVLLEEEKGNLQLQLVDFDDVKESLQSAALRANNLEEEMIILKDNLKKVLEEKEEIEKAFEDVKNTTDQQLQAVEELKASLKDVEELKISAEMRSIEVEEKLEILQSDTNKQLEQAMSEFTSLKKQFDEQSLIIASLNDQLSLKDQEIADIKGNNFPAEVETETRLKEIEFYNSELVEKIRELQLKCEGHEQAALQLQDTLSERNETISQLKLKYETALNSLESENVRLKSLESLVKKEKLSNEGSNVNAESKDDNILEQKFKKLAASYKIKAKLCQELEEKLKNFNDVLEEKNREVMHLSEQETELRKEIDSLKSKEVSCNQELENIKIKNCKLMAIIEDLTPKLEVLEAERSAALVNVDKMNRAFEELKEWKEGDSKLLKEHVTSVNSMASHVLILEEELGKLQSIVNDKNSVIGELETERKKLVEDMKNSEVELERLRALYEQESVKNQNVLTNLQGLENEMLVSREEMNLIADQLDAVTRNYNMCLGNLHDRENYIEALEQDIVSMKSKMYNLESGIEDKHRMLQERGNQLSAKLEEAEILRHTYDKYQIEMEKKFNLMEENERSFKNTVFELQNEIGILKNSNSELIKEIEISAAEKSKMSSEIRTLNDIRNSYNATLDRIEILNEELKQVMDDFEAKNQELIKLSEERSELFNKLTDLEEVHADMKNLLAESEEVTKKLNEELNQKNIMVADLQNEISSLQVKIEQLNSTESKQVSKECTSSSEKEEPVSMFSWDQHNLPVSLKNEQENLRSQLEEKNNSLEAALHEIGKLKSTIDSISKQKDVEISSLQEQINKLIYEQSNTSKDLESAGAETLDKKQDVRVFSWDEHSQEMGKGDEEGWGWIGAEAHLEHKHSEALQIQNLTQRVKELEEEQKDLISKLRSSKIKCVQLLKKLKDTEAINEQSKNERKVGFSDLDFALQEELRAQLDQLETKNKELLNELNSLKLEKDNLSKRVDVLFSANEQLIEMKERQDIEVQMWQKRSSELKNEMQGLQWTIEELKSEVPSHSKGDDDLTEKFNALVAENEELQRVICNLKDGRPIGSPETTLELNTVKEELKKLKEIRSKEKETFESENKKANEEIDAMELQVDALTRENQDLKEKLTHIINSKQEEISSLNENIHNLLDDKKKLEEKIFLSKDAIIESENINRSELEVQLNIAKEEILSLKTVIDEKSRDNDNAFMQIANLKRETESLLEKIQTIGIENSQLKEKLTSFSEQLTSSHKNYEVIENVNSQLNSSRNEVISLQNEVDLLNSKNADLQKQIQNIGEVTTSDIKKHVEHLHRNNETISKLEHELNSAQGYIRDIERCIEDLFSKLQVSTVSNNGVEKLTELLAAIVREQENNMILKKEILTLKEEISKNASNISSPEPVNATLPVFKGFFASSNDPFENITENQEKSHLDGVKNENKTENLQVMLSKVQEENKGYQREIKDLSSRLSNVQEQLGKVNMQLLNKSEELKFTLERSETEINHWREQVDSLKLEINNLVQRHNREIEDLKRTEEGSKEKLLEIEENYQNTLLNKEQENINLKRILSDKEQQLASLMNELNSVQNQYELISQQLLTLENRLKDVLKENDELQSELNKSKGNENTVIEKQKEEIHELMAKLEYLSQSQNLQKEKNDTEQHLRKQLTELSNHYKAVETSNNDLQRIISNQSEEISRLMGSLSEQESQRAYLESLINEKQSDFEKVSSSLQDQEPATVVSNNMEIDKYVTLIKEKDLEIERVSKVLLDTQERLVQVQESKPNDKVLSLQAKLDQALYTLHVRDVRCDELTQEIMQLLEERDTLQLRLSECLRENDILRNGALNNKPTSPELKNKLGELHRGYKRDPVVQLDMESRHNQQMNLFTKEEENTGENDASVDYGFFNWFFSSPTSNPSQQ